MKETNDRVLKPELLAPAGDLEKLRFAYSYGADAAYVGYGEYSLRSGAGFTPEQVREAKNIALRSGKRLYVAINCFAFNDDIRRLPEIISPLGEIAPDGLIVSDPGVFSLCRELVPRLPLHISTQANNTNLRTARFWAEQGARRIVLARELSLAEAAEIAAAGAWETEIFIHGALCVAYSGRCLLSQFLTGRSANHGDCSHPCRWQYALREEKRPGEFFPIEEDGRGSYILNSKDLSLLDLVPQLMAARVTSWKIEGRNKSAYYTANTVRVYRRAIDAYCSNQEHYCCCPKWRDELAAVSNREYTVGFAPGRPQADAFRYDDGGYVRRYDFSAVAHGRRDGRLILEQRNYFQRGDTLEILLPDVTNLAFQVTDIYDEQGSRLDAARHPRQRVLVTAATPDDLPWPLVCRKKSGGK